MLTLINGFIAISKENFSFFKSPTFIHWTSISCPSVISTPAITLLKHLILLRRNERVVGSYWATSCFYSLVDQTKHWNRVLCLINGRLSIFHEFAFRPSISTTTRWCGQARSLMIGRITISPFTTTGFQSRLSLITPERMAELKFGWLMIWSNDWTWQASIIPKITDGKVEFAIHLEQAYHQGTSDGIMKATTSSVIFLRWTTGVIGHCPYGSPSLNWHFT